jgi:hypothetical protein
MARAKAHELLDAICDQRDAAAGANDPTTRLDREDAALTLFKELQVGLIGLVRSRRSAAAQAALNVFDLRAAHPDAVAAGQWVWDQDVLRTSHGAAAARRVLARALLDDPTVPPGLATPAATALLLINLGENNTWLGKPTRLKGAPTTRPRDLIIDLVRLQRIYYRAGYTGTPLGDAAIVELPRDVDGKRWAALEQRRKRDRLTAPCAEAKATGQRDQRAGRPPNPPLALDYDLTMLEQLETAPRRRG